MRLVGLCMWWLATTQALGDVAVDKQWMDWLNTPPPEVVQEAALLNARADQITAELLATPSANLSLGEIDVVVSGGGNWDGYFMGVQMLLSRLEAATARSQPGSQDTWSIAGSGTHVANVTVVRHAGASAGGMMPFEVALKGENLTLQHHLAYGLLEQSFPREFGSVLAAAAEQDHHWRLMAPWMIQKWQPRFVPVAVVVAPSVRVVLP